MCQSPINKLQRTSSIYIVYQMDLEAITMDYVDSVNCKLHDALICLQA